MELASFAHGQECGNNIRHGPVRWGPDWAPQGVRAVIRVGEKVVKIRGRLTLVSMIDHVRVRSLTGCDAVGEGT